MLIAIDKYNVLFDHSDFFDPADLHRGAPRFLNSQKLMLSKIFSNHENPGLVLLSTYACTYNTPPAPSATRLIVFIDQINGTMICALSTSIGTRAYRRVCGTQKHRLQVPNYTPHEFMSMLNHYEAIDWVDVSDHAAGTNEYLYHLTQGNPKEMFNYFAAN